MNYACQYLLAQIARSLIMITIKILCILKITHLSRNWRLCTKSFKNDKKAFVFCFFEIMLLKMSSPSDVWHSQNHDKSYVACIFT